ncbi:MAG: Sec-independent protein translocase protein TatB [Gammaproteobacteria bacterium]
MFDIGFLELAVVGVVALLVFGPERLPELARTLSRWLARARDLVWSVRNEIEREFDGPEVRQAAHEWSQARLKKIIDPPVADKSKAAPPAPAADTGTAASGDDKDA